MDDTFDELSEFNNNKNRNTILSDDESASNVVRMIDYDEAEMEAWMEGMGDEGDWSDADESMAPMTADYDDDDDDDDPSASSSSGMSLISDDPQNDSICLFQAHYRLPYAWPPTSLLLSATTMTDVDNNDDAFLEDDELGETGIVVAPQEVYEFHATFSFRKRILDDGSFMSVDDGLEEEPIVPGTTTDSSTAAHYQEQLYEGHRTLAHSYNYSSGDTLWEYFWNDTLDTADKFTTQLRPASDMRVDQVVTSLYFNIGVFLFLMLSYEVLRRIFPSVYAAKKSRRIPKVAKNYYYNYFKNKLLRHGHGERSASTTAAAAAQHFPTDSSLHQLLPEDDSLIPFDWVAPVFGVPWSRVRKTAGLDAYFFLRYIRMNLRVTAVSTFWAALVLAPTFYTGSNGAEGWYLLSMVNIESGNWRMMIPVVYLYFFTAFCIFVMKQEYAHYMELRMDFLGKGISFIHPQHHYSIMVENIPFQLRSDNALLDYFSKLYPGKIHSASVIMRVPDLHKVVAKRLRIVSRLEKAIALYHATGHRPTHRVGSARIKFAGIVDLGANPCSDGLLCGNHSPGGGGGCSNNKNHGEHVEAFDFKTWSMDDNDIIMDATMTAAAAEEDAHVPRGTLVDSISYYTRDLAQCNRELFLLQQEKVHVYQEQHDRYTSRGGIHAAVSSMSDEVNGMNGNNNNNNNKSTRTAHYSQRAATTSAGTSSSAHTPPPPPPPPQTSESWFSKVLQVFEGTAEDILVESKEDNALRVSSSMSMMDEQDELAEAEAAALEQSQAITFAEGMTSMYGSLGATTPTPNSPVISPRSSTVISSSYQQENSNSNGTNVPQPPQRMPSFNFANLRNESGLEASTTSNTYNNNDSRSSANEEGPGFAQFSRPRFDPNPGGLDEGEQEKSLHFSVALGLTSSSPSNSPSSSPARTSSNRKAEKGGLEAPPAAYPLSKDISSMSEYTSTEIPGNGEPSVLKQREFKAPFSRSKHPNVCRRIAGRLGLDFVVAGIKFTQRQIDTLIAGVVGSSMGSTGFVTFLDLESVTSAVSVPLTHKPNVLQVQVAPEPRDIRWKSAHVPKKVQVRREIAVNVFLCLGVILWSIPLTAIQLFATADKVAQIPGMDWVLSFDEGSLKYFINGYLPVIAFMGLILILPVIFEWIAVHYERRKTFSEVQHSMMGRYFYYQLANVYITVTAGSLWKSLADILDHPSLVLQLLGKSLPTMVGYFISFLITKILAGLPAIILRGGALSRMILLRCVTWDQDKLTQRELDQVYRPENVLYGWEYPQQLLVIVICFSYAAICPIILPFGAIFFVGSLMVYKKQVLYVYQPVYESGGIMFPTACDRTLFGLVCAQLTLMGYTVIRQCYYEPLWLLPLPFITVYTMNYFRRHYADPSKSLSMERAMECDRISDLRVSLSKGYRHRQPRIGLDERRNQFDKASYRQPVLDTHCMEPMFYRSGHKDAITDEIRGQLEEYTERYDIVGNSHERRTSNNTNSGSTRGVQTNRPGTSGSYQNPQLSTVGSTASSDKQSLGPLDLL